MELSDKDIAQFKQLYRKYYGIELDRDTAYEKLSLLVRQMELIYRPITQDDTARLDQGENSAEPPHTILNQL